MGAVYLFLVIALTVYGQLVIKWQVGRAGTLPPEPMAKVWFLAGLLLNPWVLSGLAAAFLASVAWMATLTKFPLNVAYPFISLTFVVVMVASSVVFGESMALAQWLGLGLVVLGLVVGSQRW